jgi:hypothetical protein
MMHMLEHQLAVYHTPEATERLRILHIYRTNHVYVVVNGKIIVHTFHAIARKLNSGLQAFVDGKSLL